MKSTWLVAYNARLRGAIGEFSVVRVSVSAKDQAEALLTAMSTLNSRGYECAMPQSCTKV